MGIVRRISKKIVKHPQIYTTKFVGYEQLAVTTEQLEQWIRDECSDTTMACFNDIIEGVTISYVACGAGHNDLRIAGIVPDVLLSAGTIERLCPCQPKDDVCKLTESECMGLVHEQVNEWRIQSI